MIRAQRRTILHNAIRSPPDRFARGTRLHLPPGSALGGHPATGGCDPRKSGDSDGVSLRHIPHPIQPRRHHRKHPARWSAGPKRRALLYIYTSSWRHWRYYVDGGSVRSIQVRIKDLDMGAWDKFIAAGISAVWTSVVGDVGTVLWIATYKHVPRCKYRERSHSSDPVVPHTVWISARFSSVLQTFIIGKVLRVCMYRRSYTHDNLTEDNMSVRLKGCHLY